MVPALNRSFTGWGDIFGDPFAATALLDRPLRHASAIEIEGAGYRLRDHAGLIPEHVRAAVPIKPPKKKRRQPGKETRIDAWAGSSPDAKGGGNHLGASGENSNGIDRRRGMKGRIYERDWTAGPDFF